jgi:hypothetical protein
MRRHTPAVDCSGSGAVIAARVVGVTRRRVTSREDRESRHQRAAVAAERRARRYARACAMETTDGSGETRNA